MEYAPMVSPASQPSAASRPEPSRKASAPVAAAAPTVSAPGDRLSVTNLDVGDLSFSDVEHVPARLDAIRAIGRGNDPAAKIRLQDAIDRWTQQALDACFKSSSNQDEKTALADYHAEMEAFAQRIGLVPMVEQGIQKAVTKREASLQPQAPPQGFFAKAYHDVTGVIGAIVNVVNFVTTKTMDAVGWLIEKGLHLVGLALGLPLKGLALGLDAMGAHRAAKDFRTGARGLLRGIDAVGQQLHGFLAGLGEAIKASFDGVLFLFQHPILALKGLYNMVRHPSLLWVGMQAMWLQARQGGLGHALGYIVGTAAPMFLSGGTSDATLVGKLANSSLLENTMASRALIATTMRTSNVMEIVRRMATFDIGGVVDGISNFDKPLVPVVPISRAGSISGTARGAWRAVSHPGDTAHAVANEARSIPGRVEARGRAMRARISEARIAVGELGRAHGSVIDRVLAAQAAFQKAGRTPEEVALVAKEQEIADKVEAGLASSDLRQAFRALYEGKFAEFNQAIGGGADAISKIQTLQHAINDISQISRVVGDVTNPGGTLEGRLSHDLEVASGRGLTNNEAMSAMALLHLNQDSVYAGDEARLERDKANGILKVLNPL